MEQKTRKLIILVLLVVIWAAFLFIYETKKQESRLNSSYEATSNITRSSPQQEPQLDIKEAIPITIPELIEEPVREKCGDFYCYSSEEFVDMYNNFEETINLPRLPKYIYNNKKVDAYLKNIAEALGYRKRVFAHEDTLISFENVRTLPQVRDAYIAMRDEMKEQDILLHFVSGYRDSTSQRAIFLKKIGLNEDIDLIPTGIYDSDIYEALSLSALPGYSKHHSGYAVDFGCGSDYLVYSFAETPCYEWMSVNNFENTKRFGFIPSYPEGVESQGPDPEPWEFVWVGADYLD